MVNLIFIAVSADSHFLKEIVLDPVSLLFSWFVVGVFPLCKRDAEQDIKDTSYQALSP